MALNFDKKVKVDRWEFTYEMQYGNLRKIRKNAMTLSKNAVANPEDECVIEQSDEYIYDSCALIVKDIKGLKDEEGKTVPFELSFIENREVPLDILSSFLAKVLNSETE